MCKVVVYSPRGDVLGLKYHTCVTHVLWNTYEIVVSHAQYSCFLPHMGNMRAHMRLYACATHVPKNTCITHVFWTGMWHMRNVHVFGNTCITCTIYMCYTCVLMHTWVPVIVLSVKILLWNRCLSIVKIDSTICSNPMINAYLHFDFCL